MSTNTLLCKKANIMRIDQKSEPDERPFVWRGQKIYALLHPLTRQPHYIGRTQMPPTERLSNHCSDARHGKRPVQVWIRELQAVGLRPEMLVIETVQDPAKSEAFWISAARRWAAACGYSLLNVPRPRALSEQTRKRIGERVRKSRLLRAQYRQ